MNFDVPTFNTLWNDDDFKDHKGVDFEGNRYISFTVESYKLEAAKGLGKNCFTITDEKIEEKFSVNDDSTTSELEKFVDKFYEHFYKPPPYSKPGNLLVKVTDISESDKPEWEYEIIDYDGNSGVFWISEGVGFSFWLDGHCEFEKEGTYLIKNIVGHYYKGTWGFDDDDEEWNYDSIELVDDNYQL